MKVIRKTLNYKSRSDVFGIIPLGDIHLGAEACDEKRFQSTIDYIKQNNYYWIGMGDYCDFINRRDPRFSQASMAKWLWGEVDLVKAQKRKFLSMIEPIAPLCLAMVEGNHESAILKHTERDVYGEIVSETKSMAGMKESDPLGVGYYGWLQLIFRRGAGKPNPTTIFNVNLHHGFVGGKLAGAKALNMQRWLWNHSCDLAIFGHSHNTAAQPEAVEELDRNGNVQINVRKGCYGGTFLRTTGDGYSTYSEIKGYFPLPMDGVEIMLYPGKVRQPDRIKLIT